MCKARIEFIHWRSKNTSMFITFGGFLVTAFFLATSYKIQCEWTASMTSCTPLCCDVSYIYYICINCTWLRIWVRMPKWAMMSAYQKINTHRVSLYYLLVFSNRYVHVFRLQNKPIISVYRSRKSDLYPFSTINEIRAAVNLWNRKLNWLLFGWDSLKPAFSPSQPSTRNCDGGLF